MPFTKLTGASCEVDVRSGTVADVPLLLSFIHRMAEFEQLDVTATEGGLREVLFGPHPVAETLLAFVEGVPAAYVVYYFGFSTMTGKRVLHLEDLFVVTQFRRKGIARALMGHLARLAVETQCVRLEWVVLDWNTTAIDFYKSQGAGVLADWRVCRIEGRALEQLASATLLPSSEG